MTDIHSLDYNNLEECIKAVMEILENATNIMAKAVNMPLAEPDDPVWNEFHKKPYVHEAVDIFCHIFDAGKIAKETIGKMKGER